MFVPTIKYNTGDILFLRNPPIEGRRTKYGIVVCPDKRWILYINTKKTDAFRGPKLSHKEHDFLEGKDRYISCTHVESYTHDFDGYNEVEKTCGHLNRSDLENLRSYVATSATIPPIQQIRIDENIATRIESL